MPNLKELTIFELKKVFKKKSMFIGVIVILIVTIASSLGTLLGNEYSDDSKISCYEGMLQDKKFATEFSGRPIDEDFLMEAANAYAKVDYETGVNYNETEKYQEYARAYSPIYGIARTIINTPQESLGAKNFANLDKAVAQNIYKIREEKIQNVVDNYPISDKAKAMLMEDNAKISTPVIYQYTGGYQRFMSMMYTTGILMAFFCVVATAPIFSGEYTSGADQLILSSKNGKKSLIKAKLLAGFIIAMLSALILTGVTYIICMIVFGADGANAVIQLKIPLSTDNLTMSQVATFNSVAIMVSNFMIIGITMLLSAKLKSPSGVIVIMSVLLVVPMFINVSLEWPALYNLNKLLTTNMMGLWTVNDPIPFEFMGLIVRTRVAVPMLGMLIFLITLPFSYKGFKNHQVN